MSTQVAHERVPVDTFEMRLVIARFAAGDLSAAEAGALVGVTGTTWRNWERGHAKSARKPAMLAFIADRLGVDVEWLRDGGPLRQVGNGGGPTLPKGSLRALRNVVVPPSWGRRARGVHTLPEGVRAA